MILASRPRSNVEKKINLKSFDGQNSNEIEPYDLRPFLRRKSVVALNFSFMIIRVNTGINMQTIEKFHGFRVKL